MRNWDDLKYCLALHRHGTMSDAAKVLGTNVATVSRRLHRLSEEVGETLFVKEGNRWAVTEAGAEFARIADQLQSKIGHSGAQSRSIDDIDLIRLSCAMQIMQCGLVEGIVRFSEAHPKTRLRLESRQRSLALNECDIRIGFEEPTEGRVVRRFLMALEMIPVCCAGFRGSVSGWVDVAYTQEDPSISRVFEEHLGEPPKVEIEGLNLTRLILSRNPLVAALPRVFVDKHPDLVEYPMPNRLGTMPVWLSYHESRRRDATVRLSVEFLEQAMKPEIHGGYVAVG